MAFDRTTTTTITHPRTFSASSSSSTSSSMSSSSPKRAAKRTSWATPCKERPSWLDTTSVKAKESHTHPLHHPVPESPPSSPLPLDFHKASDIDSEEDYFQCQQPPHHDKKPQTQNRRPRVNSESADEKPTSTMNTKDQRSLLERTQSPSTPITSRRNSSSRANHHSNTSAITSRAESDQSRTKELSRTLKKQSSATSTVLVGGAVASSSPSTGDTIKGRPRFTLSTNVNPRPPAYTTTGSTVTSGTATASTIITASPPSSKSKQSKTCSQTGKSTTNLDTACPEARKPSKTVSATRLSSRTRSPTTITMSTTRRVVSTTINVGGQSVDINRRKESTITTTVVAGAKKSSLGLGLTGLGLTCNRTERAGHHLRSKSPITTTTTTAGPVTSGSSGKDKAKAILRSDEADAVDSEKSPLGPAAEIEEPQDTSANDATLFAESLEGEIICQELEALDRDHVGDDAQEDSTVVLTLSNYDFKGDHTCDNIEMDSGKQDVTVKQLGILVPLDSPLPLAVQPQEAKESKLPETIPVLDVSYVNDNEEINVDSVASVEICTVTQGMPSLLELTKVVSSTTNNQNQEQGKTLRRGSILAALREELSRAPLTKAKEPAVMIELMTFMKEQRATNTVSRSRSMTNGSTDLSDRNDIDNDTNGDSDPSNVNGNNPCNNNKSDSVDPMLKGDGTCGRNARRPSDSVHISSTSTAPSMTCISFHEKKSFLKLQEMRRNRLKRSQSANATASTSTSTSYTVDYFNSAHSSSAPTYYPTHLSPYQSESTNSVMSRQSRPSADRLSPSILALAAIPPKAANVLLDMGYPLYKSASTPDLLSTSAPALTSLVPSKSRSASISMTSLLSSSSRSASPSLSAASTKRSMSTTSLPASFPECLFTSRSPSPSPSLSSMSRTPSPYISRASTPSRLTRDVVGTTTHVAGSSSLTVPYMNRCRSKSYESIPTESRRMIQQRQQQQCSSRAQGQFWKAIQKHECEDSYDVSFGGRSRNSSVDEHERRYSFGSQATDLSGDDDDDEDGEYQQKIIPRVEIEDEDFGTVEHVPSHPRDFHYSQDSALLNPANDYFNPGPSQTRLYSQEQPQQSHRRRPAREHDISLLTKRLANLQLMDSLCPGKSCPEEQQPKMDSVWGAQIQRVLGHLSEQADVEDKATKPSIGAGANAGSNVPIGTYEMVLTDWVQRLGQVSDGVYKDHPWLKREVDKICWQHGISKKNSMTKSH
ncbi:hypothetical protein BGZ80_008848 [Entomortierella chlamydospora]|uniref:Uncharacterized protein n=1 Tax=Entomortierella chlamydospora TaxID=101097 RepID=A0A9P6MX37_9FUNG|nr:hypothetical protein BGZ80_008848 [Entomortierella chlamydospora]